MKNRFLDFTATKKRNDATFSTHVFRVVQLLLLIDRQACTRHTELDDKEAEQDDHVEEQRHLVVFDGAPQPQSRDAHEEEAAGRDAGDNGEGVHVGGPLAVDGNAEEDQAKELE